MGETRVLHCWKDEREHIEKTEGQTERYWETYETGGGTCMLLDGHDGPHVFTPDSEIGIRFAPAPPLN